MKKYEVLTVLVLFAFSSMSMAAKNDEKEARNIYTQRCAACHGPSGRGDGPAASNLSPRPRNYADSKWQQSVTDEHLAKVIVEGGPSAGLSPMMAANDDLKYKPGVVAALVAIIRSFSDAAAVDRIVPLTDDELEPLPEYEGSYSLTATPVITSCKIQPSKTTNQWSLKSVPSNETLNFKITATGNDPVKELDAFTVPPKHDKLLASGWKGVFSTIARVAALSPTRDRKSLSGVMLGREKDGCLTVFSIGTPGTPPPQIFPTPTPTAGKADLSGKWTVTLEPTSMNTCSEVTRKLPAFTERAQEWLISHDGNQLEAVVVTGSAPPNGSVMKGSFQNSLFVLSFQDSLVILSLQKDGTLRGERFAYFPICGMSMAVHAKRQ